MEEALFPDELFNLKSSEYHELQEELAGSIQHHGVKGMKWGVRRAVKRAAKNIKKSGKNLDRYTEASNAFESNSQFRPIKTIKATAKKGNRSAIIGNRKAMERVNRSVTKQTADKRKKQGKIRRGANELHDDMKELDIQRRNLAWNTVRRPITTAKATGTVLSKEWKKDKYNAITDYKGDQTNKVLNEIERRKRKK